MKNGILFLLGIGAVIFLTAEAPPTSRIPFEAARTNALNQCSGKIKSGSLEKAGSVWTYEFEIRTHRRKTCLVGVDAISGAIRSKQEVSDRR